MREDDHMPMSVETPKDVDIVLEVVWISEKERTEIKQWVLSCYLEILIFYYALDCLCQIFSRGPRLFFHAVKM